MAIKRVIVSSAAALTVALSGAVFAQTASEQATEAAAQGRTTAAGVPAMDRPSGPAQEYKEGKVDEATAADAKYHANRTEANREARDKAESDAAAAVGMPNPTGQSGGQ